MCSLRIRDVCRELQEKQDSIDREYTGMGERYKRKAQALTLKMKGLLQNKGEKIFPYQTSAYVIEYKLGCNHGACVVSGLEITAGQRTMSGLIVDLTGQTFVLPVMLTVQNSIVLKMNSETLI